MKNKFKDLKGIDWNLHIHVGIALKIKQKLSVDLMGDVEKILNQLSEDPALAIDMAWLAIDEEQKKVNSVATFEKFCERLGGDSIENLINALLETLTLFIPSRPRKILQRAIQEKKAAEAEVDQILMSGELDKLIEKSGE